MPNLSRASQRGYLIIILALTLMALPVAVYVAGRVSALHKSAAEIGGTVATRATLERLRERLAAAAADVDTDGRYEPLAAATGDLVPATVAGGGSDGWNRELTYCTWDPGAANGADATYSQNHVAPPKPGLIARLIASGADRTLQSACGDASASGDDLFAEIFESDTKLRLGSGGGPDGWQDDGANVRPISLTDKVGIGTAAPSETLEINGGLRLGAASGADAGTLRYASGLFDYHNGSVWSTVGMGDYTSAAADGNGLSATGNSVAGTAATDTPAVSLTVAAGTYLVMAHVSTYAATGNDRPLTWQIDVNGGSYETIVDATNRWGADAWVLVNMPIRIVNVPETGSNSIAVSATGAADLLLRTFTLQTYRLYP